MAMPNAVFRRLPGIKEFALEEDGGFQAGGDFVEADQRVWPTVSTMLLKMRAIKLIRSSRLQTIDFDSIYFRKTFAKSKFFFAVFCGLLQCPHSSLATSQRETDANIGRTRLVRIFVGAGLQLP